MIRANGLEKVKERLMLALVIPLILSWSQDLRAQVSENDVRTLEEQEFGVGPKTKTSPKPPAEQPAPPPAEDHQADSKPEAIKPIEAEEFKVRLLKKSRSGRVLLFEDPAENHPKPGKILLLKLDKEDIAAIRVLKNYSGKFAGKILLSFKKPEANQEFRALKKLGYKIMEMIREREARGKDLDFEKSDEELAKEVTPDDNELDRGIAPPKPKEKPKKSLKKNKGAEPLFDKEGNELITPESIEINDDGELYDEVSVSEDIPIEQLRHAVSLQYGALRNSDKDGNSTTYSAVGLRYAFNLLRMALFKRKNLQDMISAEISGFYYTISGFSDPADSITVIPFIGSLRYSLLVGESLDFFAYFGLLKNNISQSGSKEVDAHLLSTSRVALGAGAMWKIGPHWAARLDFGTDMFAIGAVLKF